MRRTLTLTFLLAMTAPLAAETTAVVLDEFTCPAWGVRWTALRFSKGVDPRFHAGPDGPDDTPSAKLMIPPGGEITLVTQAESPKFAGIRGKPRLPLPAGTRRVSIAVHPGNRSAVVSLDLQDAQRKAIATRARGVGADQWTVVTAELPAGTEGARLAGVTIRRPGPAGESPQPVLLDDLRAHLADAPPLIVTAGRADYASAPVAGQPVAFYVRAQTPGRSGADSHARVELLDEADDRVGAPLHLRLPGREDRATVRTFQLTPPAEGIYRVVATVEGPGEQAVVDTPLAVFPPERMTGTQRDTLRAKTRQNLAARADRSPMAAWLTNLSPALRMTIDARRVRLFDGLTDEKLALPTHVAVPTADGVRVTRLADAPLEKMSEGWLVLLCGDPAGWEDVVMYSRGKAVPAPISIPWMLRLEHKPASISAEDGGLTLAFDQPAGTVLLMGMHGSRTFTPEEIRSWIDRGLTEAQVRHIRTWARRLTSFPVGCVEDFQVDARNDVVTLRNRFTFETMDDDWGTEPARFAPVPPMVELARRYGMDIPFRDVETGRRLTVVDGDVVTQVGPACGIEGASEYVYELRGLLKFINEDRLPMPSGGGELADTIRHRIRTTLGQYERHTSASRWEPGSCIREDYGIAMVGNSERQGLLGSTIPYLHDDTAEWARDTLRVDAAFLVNPFNYGYVRPDYSGRMMAKEGFAHLRFGGSWVDNNAYTAEILRALSYYAKYTGDMELIRRHWPLLRAAFATVSDFPRHGEWELSCFDTGGGDTWDSVHNGTVGFARLADRMGDAASYRYACYYYAKRAVTLPGQRQVNRYVQKVSHWPSMIDAVRFNDDGLISEYHPNGGIRWDQPIATVRDLVFSDVWGLNYGLRPWNQTIWMRGSREEYRLVSELAPEYARYWLVDRVRKFAPEWHERVLENLEAPGDAIDLRTGKAVEPTNADYAGRINLAARGIILGEDRERLWDLYRLKEKGLVVVGSDGRVPRLTTLVHVLEDAADRRWVRQYGTADGATSPGWERGRDAFLQPGDENYVWGVHPTGGRVRLSWGVFKAPGSGKRMSFGTFGPAEPKVDLRGEGLNWNTTLFVADGER